jgi:NAD(P)-dependent dehydrogenase (short-subunit alcohol dehydrogenase family)
MEKTVLISGASTGIGRACALHMDKLGWRVFAGVRRDEDGESLRQAGSPGLLPVFLDVTDAGSIDRAVAIVREEVGADGLSGLVNNAGVPLGGPVELLDLEQVRKGFDVNVFGALALTQACLPLLRAARGHVVNISSISGMIAMPFVGPYAASKFALGAFSDSLRVELRPWRIPVSIVELGPIDTPIWTKSGSLLQTIVEESPEESLARYRPLAEVFAGRIGPHGKPPEIAAAVVAQALTAARPKTRYRVGLEARVTALFALLPDRLRDWLVASQLPGWN